VEDPLSIAGSSSAIIYAADSFWREAVLNSVGPIIAAGLGGLIVGLIIQRVQDRRTDLRHEEDRRRTDTERRTQLGLEVMKTSFAFYRRLIEAIREEQEGLYKIDLGILRVQYQDFRIAARVLEEQLRVYLPSGEARWLWHGVVDMLSLRYYRLAHEGSRLGGMIAGHSMHPTDVEIPITIREIFPKPEDLKLEDRVQFHNTVMERYEDMLTKLINLIVHGQLEWAGDPVALHGRGPSLSRAE
jgi:hypothetical protein